MTEQQFNDACRYANANLEDWRVDEALCFINNREPMPSETAGKIYDLMEEYCQDNGFAEGEWLEWGDEEDVFLNQE